MTTPTDALSALADAGVSIWLDDLGRHRLTSGELASLVQHQHVVGVTTNPSIFAAAVGDGADYVDQISALSKAGASLDEAVRALTVDDVQAACDVFSDVYLATHRIDGRVSLEVDPRLAGDTESTVSEASQLWTRVDRPNLMIKIPGTSAGLPAITASLAAGISINVTLIFGLPRYREVTDAWLLGLEKAAANGHDLATIGSVASFFISRFDTAVDRQLDASSAPAAAALRGRTAIANARLAYAHFEEVLASHRWLALADQGAQPQRPLWASTSTKDPSYEDTRYVVELVAPKTVNTMPPATLRAVEDHGQLRGRTISSDYSADLAVLDQLAAAGVDYDSVVEQLEREGVASFEKSWQQLRDSVQQAMERSGS
ncbi:MAG TPA: transaldolase [Actinomycetes bacterium]|nr:transaldolase [Actinomycetes bacterium]